MFGTFLNLFNQEILNDNDNDILNENKTILLSYLRSFKTEVSSIYMSKHVTFQNFEQYASKWVHIFSFLFLSAQQTDLEMDFISLKFFEAWGPLWKAALVTWRRHWVSDQLLQQVPDGCGHILHQGLREII